MARYAGSVLGLTPSTTDDNWTLSADATTKSGKIIEFSWGGEVTTSTLMRTRVTRAAQQVTFGGGTAGNVTKLHPRAATNVIDFVTTFDTTQPVLAAGDLFATSWNAHGGIVRWLSQPGEEFVMIGTAAAAIDNTISCRNSVGTALSSYACIWEED